VTEQILAFESFDNSGNSVVATNTKVVSLGNVVSEHDLRVLADTAKNSK
jgi:hypothetical protein